LVEVTPNLHNWDWQLRGNRNSPTAYLGPQLRNQLFMHRGCSPKTEGVFVVRTLIVVAVLLVGCGRQTDFEREKQSAVKTAKAANELSEQMSRYRNEEQFGQCCLRLEKLSKSVAPENQVAWKAAVERLEAEYLRRRETDGFTEAVWWYKVETAKSAAQIIASWGADAK
jgi:hypothetical protein